MLAGVALGKVYSFLKTKYKRVTSASISENTVREAELHLICLNGGKILSTN